MRAKHTAIGLLLVVLAACAHEAPAPEGAAAQAPQVVVDAAKLGPTREAACARIEARETKDLSASALAAGMLADEFEGLLRAVQDKHVTVTFRDSNPACLPHLAAGVQSKPHSILQKTWDVSNLKPEDQHLAGLVSDLFKKPPKGVIVDAPKLTLLNGEPVTCDYDMMDQIEDSGARVPGESPRDLEIRAALNDGLPNTPKGHRNRVMHGAQTAYTDYLKLHSEEKELAILYKPEAPLTTMGSDGRTWHLDTVEDALNFYRCRGVALPSNWNVVGKGPDGALTPVK